MEPLELLLKYPGPFLCWILPFIGALLTPLFAKINEKLRDYMAVAFSFSAVISTTSMIPLLLSGGSHDLKIAKWIVFPSGGALEVGVLVDPLSIIVANVVAFISFLIVIYSLGYMEGDPCLTRYWFFFQFFIGSMLLLVLSDNLIQVLIGWEGVGTCSYGLIGFYYRDSKERWLGGPPPTPMFPPSHCGMKAFVVTGIGDVFLLAAIFIIYHYAGTFNFLELIHHSEGWLQAMAAVPGLLSLTAILFLGGPIGKSAQFPLHEWLPEAMAGPTPVSALIHAATMVKAGVYLVARVSPIFYIGRWSLHITEAQTFFIVIAFIGAFTAFLAASQAIVSLELKKILAYSTVSQIGYMMLGLGVSGLSEGGFVLGLTSGIFHLVSHALFKAALFLCAGSVIHAVESIYVFDMGGLKRWMPLTHAFMLLATLSLSGIPPFSGFWSKDAVFLSCLAAGTPLAIAFLALGAVSAAMTFFYSLRMISLTFYGHPSHHIEEMEHHGHHVHEVKPIMWVPCAILVAVMVVIGVLAAVGLFIPSLSPEVFIEEQLHHMIEHTFEHMHLPVAHVEVGTKLTAVGLSVAMLLLGGLPGWFFYLARRVDPREVVESSPLLRGLHTFLWNRWYINPLYYKVFVDGLLNLKEAVFKYFEKGVMDKISDAVSGLTVWLGRGIFGTLEVEVIDKGLNVGVPRVAEGVYHRVKRIQTGVLSYNILYIILALLVLISFFMLGGM
ncbi:NADH-quinone oxidoreductase subunit L [Candidatus Bathyarchaeota archaeon]|nr:MAG: NADH-quinone oxidoreductase subunit L [Candidatus Bathyarchaeota archaeon]